MGREQIVRLRGKLDDLVHILKVIHSGCLESFRHHKLPLVRRPVRVHKPAARKWPRLNVIKIARERV